MINDTACMALVVEEVPMKKPNQGQCSNGSAVRVMANPEHGEQRHFDCFGACRDNLRFFHGATEKRGPPPSGLAPSVRIDYTQFRPSVD